MEDDFAGPSRASLPLGDVPRGSPCTSTLTWLPYRYDERGEHSGNVGYPHINYTVRTTAPPPALTPEGVPQASSRVSTIADPVGLGRLLFRPENKTSMLVAWCHCNQNATVGVSCRPITRQRAVSYRPLVCLCCSCTAMHGKLDARAKNGHIFSLLLASDRSKLPTRISVEPMTTKG